MKAILISKDQKIKLFEMCNKLFPEYKWMDGDFFRKGHLDIYNHGTEMCPNWPIYSHSIHWFEFCMTHLVDKLAFLKEDSRYEIIKESEFYRIHENMYLIDYLYQEFKKNKIII